MTSELNGATTIPAEPVEEPGEPPPSQPAEARAVDHWVTIA